MQSTALFDLLQHIQTAKKKRPVIAYLSGNIHSDHPMGIMEGLYKLLQTRDVDVRYYLGTECVSFLEGVHLDASRFDYQYLSIYEYANFDDIDVLIVGFGTISIYHSGDTIRSFLARMPKVPCILLENDTDIEGSIFLMVDNYGGMCEIISHLIEKHGCRRIGYLSGPLHNAEAARRLDAYRDTLERFGLPFREELIGYGDFSDHSDEEVEKILDAAGGALDAIVSANDEMCNGIYRVLSRRGLQIGQDILVTGFDDMAMAPFMTPPLTTLRQDPAEYCELAVDRATRIIAGEKASSAYFHPKLIIRESCGCSGHVGRRSTANLNERELLIRGIRTLHRHQQRTWIGSLILRELLIESMDTKTFFEKLARSMAYLKCEASMLCLLKKPQKLKYSPGDERQPVAVLPEKLIVPMLQYRDSYQAFSMEAAPEVERGGLGGLLATGETSQSCVFLLFYKHYQYGAFYVRMAPEDIPFYYMLSMEIGTALRYLYISLERHAYRLELQERNQMLHFTATHDTLTGLLNRSGLLDEMEVFIRAHKGETLIAIMADLDHLKQINDTFGHDAGDHAIQTSARILADAIGEKGIAGRTGGDEFMGLMQSGRDASAIRETIRRKCAEENDASGKPYLVELSVGLSSFVSEGEFGVRQLFRSADKDLYKQKERRRASVVKT